MSEAKEKTEPNVTEIQNILTQVGEITKQHDEMALASGEKFNVFDIIRIENRSEVGLHTPFIAELLNPNGIHGMGDGFLRIFCKLCDIEWTEGWKFECHKEKSFGSKDGTGMAMKGGNVDIFLENISMGQPSIVIENKPNWVEQHGQLRRYFNTIKGKTSINPILIYLTIDGRDANQNSTLDNGKDKLDYRRLSYKEDIIKWLELCQKEVYDKPLLMYSIKQYQNLVKIITNQSINKIMSKEITDHILSSNVTLNTYLNLVKCYDSVFENLIADFFENQLKLIANILGLTLSFSRGDKKKIKYYKIDLTNHKMKEKNICISFVFDNGGTSYNNLIVGFLRLQKNIKVENEELIEYEYQKIFPNAKIDKKDWNIVWSPFTNNVMWQNLEFSQGHMIQLINGKDCKNIKEILACENSKILNFYTQIKTMLEIIDKVYI